MKQAVIFAVVLLALAVTPVFAYFQGVPKPASLALAGAALVALGFIRRRRKSQHGV